MGRRRRASPLKPPMYQILFVFLDGVGLGEDDPEANPLTTHLDAFERLADGQRWTRDARAVVTPTHLFLPIDANLGMPGLPQSGTGQATLFTGVNCAEVAGRHYGPFPHSKSRPLLAKDNLFHQVERLGLPHTAPSAFVNAYPPRFFEYAKRRDRWTVTTRCCLDAGVRIRGVDDLRRGEALAADLTGQAWPTRLNLDIPLIAEGEAGRRLAHIAGAHALTLFEYFLTDKAGHSQDAGKAQRVVASLDAFFDGLLTHFDPDKGLLLLTSDHGNLEDLSTKSHTRNPVPLITYGRGADAFADVQDLTGVLPALLTALRDHA